MSLHVPQFKFFISCPGDVEKERKRIEETLKNIEAILFKKRKPVSLIPLFWKNIVAPYDSVRPQSLINVNFNEYDFYIGVLALRFGSPTTNDSGIIFGSGTEEEFKIAKDKKRDGADIQMYIFFKRIGREPTDSAAREQYARVKTFKKDIQGTGWVNSYKDVIDLGDQISRELLPLIEEKIDLLNAETVTELKTSPQEHGISDEDNPFAKLTGDIPEIEKPIARTVTLESGDPIADLLFRKEQKKRLRDLVTEKKRLVVLGNAGSGKTTELGRVAEFYQKQPSAFVPIFKRLNTYLGGPVADFMPVEFYSIPENVALVMLDGLDEVASEHFNEAVRQIDEFSATYPESTIVISCRTNFYELSAGATFGTLTGFEISHINEIDRDDIIKSVGEYGLDGETFYAEAYHNGYQELISKPFFLNILTAVYKHNNNLNGGRAFILREGITQLLQIQASAGAGVHEHIIKLLTRLGLAMEFLGRNYISDAEAIQLIADIGNRTLLEDSLIVTRNKGNWLFVHNNIQEYFAASAIAGLKFEQIRALVSFYPEYAQINPAWLNTLSFLMSIINNDTRRQLLDWIITVEPESVIRFEPGRVDADTRFEVFKKIFNDFQEKQLWIRSNKFTEAELGRFGDTPASLALLKQVINDPEKTRLNKLSAIHLIDDFKLPPEEVEPVKQLILGFVDSYSEEADAIYPAIHVLANKGMADAGTVRDFVNKFKNRKEPYYRASLYVLLNKSGFTNDYTDIFLDGIKIAGNRGEGVGRTSSLWDETAQLKNGLLKISGAEPIIKVLEFFSEPYSNEYRYYSDKKEVIESAVQKAVELYPGHPSFYDLVLRDYVNYSKGGNSAFLQIFSQFFEKTGNIMRAFQAIYQMDRLTSFELEFLLSFLVDKETTEFLIAEFTKGKITIEWLQSFYRNSSHHTLHSDDYDKIQKLARVFLSEAGLNVDPPPNSSFREKRKKKEQASFDLLFDAGGMKKELERFWQEIGKEEVNFNEVWDFANMYERDADAYFPRSVTDVVADMVRGYYSITADAVKTYLTETAEFEHHLIRSIYTILKNNSEIVLSGQQKNALGAWVNEQVQTRSIANAIQTTGNLDDHVLMMWFFIDKLGILIPDDKLLEFTLFDDYSNRDIEEWFGLIAKQVGVAAVEEKVIANLITGIKIEQVWAKNAEYALTNGLIAAYDYIKADLIHLQAVSTVKTGIVRQYLEVTNDHQGLLDVLDRIKTDTLRWEIVDLLKSSSVAPQVISRLLNILHSSEETTEEKLEASKRLTELDVKEGFEYYADHILRKPQIRNRYDFWFRYLNNLTSIDYLPKLFQLLEKSLKPENTADSFTRIDGQVMEAIFNLSMHSPESFLAVKTGLEKKIREHSPDWNYLDYTLKRMDFQFNLNRSQDAGLDTAIVVVNILGL